MAHRPQDGELFDRDLDAWPSAPAAGAGRWTPRTRAGRIVGIIGLSLFAGGLAFAQLWPMPGGQGHPWLAFLALWFASMTGVGVTLIMALSLTRHWLPELRLTRVARLASPGKPARRAASVARSPAAPPTPPRTPDDPWRMVRSLVLYALCPLVFLVIALGVNLVIFVPAAGNHPFWHHLIPPLVAAVPTVGLAAVVFVLGSDRPRTPAKRSG